MVFNVYYKKLVKKDFILKDVTETYKEVPEMDKLELVIYYPKVIDNFDKMVDGVIYLEELSGQFPIIRKLSTKRVGASDYETNYLIKTSLRKESIYNFLFFLHVALLFFWTQRRMVLTFSKKLDSQTKVVKLFKKEFFYFFNMPLIYDERRDSWNFQLHFYMKNSTVNIELLGAFFSCFFIYDILNLHPKEIILTEETLFFNRFFKHYQKIKKEVVSEKSKNPSIFEKSKNQVISAENVDTIKVNNK